MPTYCNCELCQKMRNKSNKLPDNEGQHPLIKIKGSFPKIDRSTCESYIELAKGKYIVYQKSDPYEFKALRYREDWRNLCGDNLVFFLVEKIKELQRIVNNHIK